MTTLQTTQRKVTSDFITDILSLDIWKSHTERVIVYANLVARFQEDTVNQMALTNSLASKALKVDPKADGFHEAVYRCNKAVHNLTDDDGEWLWNDDGRLCDIWEQDSLVLATALLEATPPAFLPTQTQELLGDYPFHRETHLINNRSQQQRKDMPSAYAALDVLYSQGYRLNEDIMNLKNLPMDMNINKNYAAKVIALQNIGQFHGEFFFKYTMDSRGRAYARSTVVQPQGSSFDKAVLNFSDAKPLGQYGLQALMIHYANCSGHDKLSFTGRMAWVRREGRMKAVQMAACKGDWIAIMELIEDSKHAFEEYAAAMEYYRASNYAKTDRYMSALVTHQDATNSGFQFGAALTGDRQTAEDVNITAGRNINKPPADLYGKMATNLKPLVTAMQDALPPVDRKFCKKPIMVTGYGAGIKAVMTDIQEWAEDFKPIDDATLEELKPFVKQALEETASGMLKFTAVIRDQGAVLVEELGRETIEWVAPDGFRCIQEYRDNQHRQVYLNKRMVTYTKLEKGTKDPVDMDKMSTALPPNFIHSIDAQVLRTAALMADVQGIAYCPIHDSFGTHAATFFSLNIVLKEAFVETMSYPWYESFCQTNGIPVVDIKLGDYDASECLKATYMFS